MCNVKRTIAWAADNGVDAEMFRQGNAVVCLAVPIGLLPLCACCAWTCLRVCALVRQRGRVRNSKGRGGRVEAEEECKPPPLPKTGAFAQIVCAAFSRHFSRASLLLLLFCLRCNPSAKCQPGPGRPTDRCSPDSRQHQGFNHGDQSVHSIVLWIHFGKG